MEIKQHHRFKHGLSYMREYYIFTTIMARCYSVNDHNYKYYGARGISIISEWRNNPKLFIDYIKSLPNYGVKNYSLDRIDNDGNYEPGNLRWASKRTQVLNRRNTNTTPRLISYVKAKKKWRIRISINSKKKHIGYAKNIESAIIKRDAFILSNKIEGY